MPSLDNLSGYKLKAEIDIKNYSKNKEDINKTKANRNFIGRLYRLLPFFVFVDDEDNVAFFRRISRR